jgi:hypothetical protein
MLNKWTNYFIKWLLIFNLTDFHISIYKVRKHVFMVYIYNMTHKKISGFAYILYHFYYGHWQKNLIKKK